MLGISAKNQSRSLFVFYLFHVWAGFSIFAHDIGYFSLANRSTESKNDGFDIKHAITMFKEAIRNISDYLGDADTGPPMPPKCLKVQCRIICTNGRQGEIAQDISLAIASPDNSDPCDIIDELYLYNYRFSNAVVPVGFLSTYTNKIKQLYLGISNIQAIENGAFGGGIFNRIILEDLHLNKIDKEFLANVSGDLKGISIIQHNRALQCVYPDFLDYVMYQLEYLRLQVGIDCVRNVTGTDPILGALTYADFSYNNFTDQLLKDTFIKLTMVETLILSHSNIEYLPNYIFQGLKYLEYLDISYNKLMTLSKIIFGVQEISNNLRIVANSNNWHCDCQLQKEMNEIFIYHNSKLDMFCTSPEEYMNWMVFDDRLCENYSEVPPSAFMTTTTPRIVTTTTTSTSPKTTTDNHIFVPTLSTAGTVIPNEIVSLECISTNNTFKTNENRQNIRWPQINFSPAAFGALTVKISVEQGESTSALSFGLFWFSKTTKEYYMMELIPDEFGLGCYFTMPLQTIVTDLMPNVAYTFCLVDDQHNTVSPFSCKSVHIGGNLEAYYDAWLSKGMRAKGISLLILGVVVFMLVGIMLMFLVLKKKPIWVKGSKRIMKPNSSSGEIVVLSRGNTAKDFLHKEKMISTKTEPRFNSNIPRRNSMDSLASSNSYISPNLYEVIPTYITFDKIPQGDAPSQPGFEIFNNWHSSFAHRGSVRYAQITPRTKRISSDPLPAVPDS